MANAYKKTKPKARHKISVSGKKVLTYDPIKKKGSKKYYYPETEPKEIQSQFSPFNKRTNKQINKANKARKKKK